MGHDAQLASKSSLLISSTLYLEKSLQVMVSGSYREEFIFLTHDKRSWSLKLALMTAELLTLFVKTTSIKVDELSE